MEELELYFKNRYGSDFVTALPFEDTFQLPHLKKLGLLVDEIDTEGPERIRTFLRRFFSISQNFESFHATGSNNGMQVLVATLFFEEIAKIPGRMEKITELNLRPASFLNRRYQFLSLKHKDFVALHVLTLSVTSWNIEEAEEILHKFRKRLTKLVIHLEEVLDEEDDYKVKIPVMENLEELGAFTYLKKIYSHFVRVDDSSPKSAHF